MAEDARELYEATTNPELEAELVKRGLPKTGNKAEMVDRLLEHDAEQAAPATPPADDPAAPAEDETPADPEVEDGELCVVCWPDGWPTPDTNNASCEHGRWDR